MRPHDPLQHRRDEILHEIAGLGAMRKGSLCKRMLPWKTAQGHVKRRGPYWYYTYKKGQRTVAKLVKDDEVALFQEQIEHFRRFQSLTREYVELCHRQADQEAQSAGRKKSSAKSSKRKSSVRQPRS
jgi:hypothetical protein